MTKLTRPLQTSLLALAVLTAIVLDGVLWGPGFGRGTKRFSQWPMDVPAQAFTDWQDRDPEESLKARRMPEQWRRNRTLQTSSAAGGCLRCGI